MDPRVKYWFAAEENIEAAGLLLDKGDKAYQDPLYWANLLCGIGNATMAALPDSVIAEVEAERGRRAALQKKVQRRVQKQIRDKLHG